MTNSAPLIDRLFTLAFDNARVLLSNGSVKDADMPDLSQGISFLEKTKMAAWGMKLCGKLGLNPLKLAGLEKDAQRQQELFAHLLAQPVAVKEEFISYADYGLGVIRNRNPAGYEKLATFGVDAASEPDQQLIDYMKSKKYDHLVDITQKALALRAAQAPKPPVRPANGNCGGKCGTCACDQHKAA